MMNGLKFKTREIATTKRRRSTLICFQHFHKVIPAYTVHSNTIYPWFLSKTNSNLHRYLKSSDHYFRCLMHMQCKI